LHPCLDWTIKPPEIGSYTGIPVPAKGRNRTRFASAPWRKVRSETAEKHQLTEAYKPASIAGFVGLEKQARRIAP